MAAVQRLKSRALDVVRRGRPVAWVPEWMGLGNLLYMAKWAHDGQEQGEDRRVLLHPKRECAAELFPVMRERLFVSRHDVRFTDQRVMPWSGPRPDYPARTDPAADESFIRDMLLPGTPLQVSPHDFHDAVVVNVRRGDYFSVSAHYDEFGMDQVGYVRAAVEQSISDQGMPSRFVIISDGVDWCGEALGSVLSPIAPVSYEDGDLAHDLASIIHARRLIITNSTFSYWGGYIGDVLHPGREVIAPWFFSRSQDGGRATQLRPHWVALQGDFY